MDGYHRSTVESMQRLQRQGVPLVAFGQTVFWDEPVKAAVVRAIAHLAPNLRLIAGVHDTDYFSKLPGRFPAPERYALLPHNDHSTRGIWAATGETSALFASETWVSLQQLSKAGVAVQKALQAALGDEAPLDSWTEAWGWRGVADTKSSHTVACEVQTGAVLPKLEELVRWGCRETLRILGIENPDCKDSYVEQRLLLRLRDLYRTGHCPTLSNLYAHLLPELYHWLGAPPAHMRTTTSTAFFHFCPRTAGLPRFEPLTAFLNPDTRDTMRQIYDRATQGSGMYELDKFGDGTIPFDLVVPGMGRGTIRVLGSRLLVDFDVEPKTLQAERPIESALDLAHAIENAFPVPAALVGKALVLPLMFLRETVMVLHQGASAYIPRTSQIVAEMKEAGHPADFHPILRVAYHTWDALAAADRELFLPPHLAQAFDKERVTSEEFAHGWQDALDNQRRLLDQLSPVRTPWQVDDLLDRSAADWQKQQREYSEALALLRRFGEEISRLQERRSELRRRIRDMWDGVRSLEHQSGRLRKQLFAASPPNPAHSPDAIKIQQQRRRLAQEMREERISILQQKAQLATLRREIGSLAQRLGVDQAAARHDQVRSQAELSKTQVARNALLTQGLVQAGHRPCAWWFPTADPQGKWFDRVVETMEMRLEFLGQGDAGA